MREHGTESTGLDGEIFAPGEPLPDDDDKTGRGSRSETRVRARFFQTLKKAARQIPFMEDLVAAYYCALDPATPPKVRGTLIAALAYFVLPLDAVPDFILGIGFGDDVAVLMAAIGLVRAHIRDEHFAAARAVLKDQGEDN